MNKSIMIAGTLAFSLLSAPLMAADFSIDGTLGHIPDDSETNEILADLGLPAGPDPFLGYFGSTVTISGASRVKVEVIGFEAGVVNYFTFADLPELRNYDYTTSTNGDGTPQALPSELAGFPTFFTEVVGGQLEFSFRTTNPATAPQIAANGSNFDDSDENLAEERDVNFFASFGGTDATSGGVLWLFFDDNGASNDDNHDDFVIRISAVPLPAALLPFVAAIGGLGALGARRRQKEKKSDA